MWSEVSWDIEVEDKGRLGRESIPDAKRVWPWSLKERCRESGSLKQ